MKVIWILQDAVCPGEIEVKTPFGISIHSPRNSSSACSSAAPYIPCKFGLRLEIEGLFTSTSLFNHVGWRKRSLLAILIQLVLVDPRGVAPQKSPLFPGAHILAGRMPCTYHNHSFLLEKKIKSLHRSHLCDRTRDKLKRG